MDVGIPPLFLFVDDVVEHNVPRHLCIEVAILSFCDLLCVLVFQHGLDTGHVFKARTDVGLIDQTPCPGVLFIEAPYHSRVSLETRILDDIVH